MVGFPGESESDFSELYNFVREIEFDWLGAFTFNPEEGTKASTMPDQIDEELKLARKDAILKLQAGITRAKNMARIDKVARILVSSSLSSNLYMGRGYFQAPGVDGITMVKSRVRIDKGSMVNVQFKGIRNYDMIGESLDEYSK
jgi:ribosomal protein S12 methylthiotransferase